MAKPHSINKNDSVQLKKEINCAKGSYFNGNDCVVCSQGMTSDGGSSQCYCPPGTYQSSADDNQCYSCSFHHYSSKNNAIECEQCPSDKISSPTQDSCISYQQCDKTHGFVLNIQLKACYCPQNTKLSIDKKSCVSSCGQNAHEVQLRSKDKNFHQYQCQCDNGYIKSNLSTHCVLSGESQDESIKLVKEKNIQVQPRFGCKKNQYTNGSKCVDCPEGSISGGGGATICACLNGKVWNAGQCVEHSVDNDPTRNKSNGLSGGAVAGIVIAILIIVAIAIAVPLVIKRKNLQNHFKLNLGTKSNLVI